MPAPKAPISQPKPAAPACRTRSERTGKTTVKGATRKFTVAAVKKTTRRRGSFRRQARPSRASRSICPAPPAARAGWSRQARRTSVTAETAKVAASRYRMWTGLGSTAIRMPATTGPTRAPNCSVISAQALASVSSSAGTRAGMTDFSAA
jgi:hypothetical protein